MRKGVKLISQSGFDYQPRNKEGGHAMIHVKRNVTHPQRNQPEITTPKTKAGMRTIPLTEPLKDILLPTKPKGFIIGGDNPLTLSAFRAMWKRIVNTIDLHGATPHIKSP